MKHLTLMVTVLPTAPKFPLSLLVKQVRLPLKDPICGQKRPVIREGRCITVLSTIQHILMTMSEIKSGRNLQGRTMKAGLKAILQDMTMITLGES